MIPKDIRYTEAVAPMDALSFFRQGKRQKQDSAGNLILYTVVVYQSWKLQRSPGSASLCPGCTIDEKYFI